MNETHGFSKQYSVCINEIISFHLSFTTDRSRGPRCPSSAYPSTRNAV